MNAYSKSEQSPLIFDNRWTRELPADPQSGPTRRQIRAALFSRVQPQPGSRPQLVVYSREVADSLSLSPQYCQSDEFTQVMTGNRGLPGMDPHASCYGGHQFGNWAGQLGDGRAINLGEVRDHRGEHQMLQLKGAGPTPYSRSADGFAVLRSSVREFLCSEAMYHLGVPTTRALSLTLTGDLVVRDMLYDGHPAPEPGAVVCRVAPSFIRFGHFELLAARQEIDLLRQFTEFTLHTSFADLLPENGRIDKTTLINWFETVCRRTADMIVHWQRVGFVHGVMNTDNMSVLGLTIDYGPYGWVENFDPDWTPNTTDAGNRRYRFGQQAAVAQWNLVRLANAIYPLIEEADLLETVLASFEPYYHRSWLEMMGAKLGLAQIDPATDASLIAALETVLQSTEIDMTLFYRQLSRLEVNGAAETTPAAWLASLQEAFYQPESVTGDIRAGLEQWLEQYQHRLREQGVSDLLRQQQMQATNPKYVLRNYLAQQAIDKAETGDFSMIHELLDLLRQPYSEQPERQSYAARRPEWARTRVGCSQLSCSS